MTTVYGYARDPESGAPTPGRLVTATVWPSVDGSVSSDSTISDASGRWELLLAPTAGTGTGYRVRVWRWGSVYIDVPDSAGEVLADDIEVDPGSLEPAPSDPTLYLTRGELGQPLGPASLGANGKVPAAQLPASSGGTGIDVEQAQELIDASVAGHVAAPTPHPAYDDMADLTLIFQNGLV